MHDTNDNDNPTLTRAEQARINGAKSHGPTSAQGKARSSLNALKHGAYASHAVLLANEDPLAFELSHLEYVRRFNPIDQFERDLVREICDIEWIRRRYSSIEASLINSQLALEPVPGNLQDSPCPEPELTASAYDHVGARSRTLFQVQRILSQLSARRERALTTLEKARRNFPNTKRTQDPLDQLQSGNPA